MGLLLGGELLVGEGNESESHDAAHVGESGVDLRSGTTSLSEVEVVSLEVRLLGALAFDDRSLEGFGVVVNHIDYILNQPPELIVHFFVHRLLWLLVAILAFENRLAEIS